MPKRKAESALVTQTKRTLTEEANANSRLPLHPYIAAHFYCEFFPYEIKRYIFSLCSISDLISFSRISKETTNIILSFFKTSEQKELFAVMQQYPDIFSHIQLPLQEYLAILQPHLRECLDKLDELQSLNTEILYGFLSSQFKLNGDDITNFNNDWDDDNIIPVVFAFYILYGQGIQQNASTYAENFSQLLCHLIGRNCLKSAEVLLLHGVKSERSRRTPSDIQSSFSITCLHLAALQNNLAAITLLQKYNANPMALDEYQQRSSYLTTDPVCLNQLLATETLSIEEKILEIQAAIDAQCSTNLIITRFNYLTCEEIFSFLWENFLLASDPTMELIEQILNHRNFDINFASPLHKGGTLLHFAVMEDSKDLIRLLLRRPEINLELQDDTGQTAYDISAELGYNAIFETEKEIKASKKSSEDASANLHYCGAVADLDWQNLSGINYDADIDYESDQDMLLSIQPKRMTSAAIQSQEPSEMEMNNDSENEDELKYADAFGRPMF